MYKKKNAKKVWMIAPTTIKTMAAKAPRACTAPMLTGTLHRTRDEGEKGAERGHKGVRSHGITLHHVQIPMVIFSSAAILLVLA